MEEKSKFGTIGKSDLIKSAIMAGGSVIATALIIVLQGVTSNPPVYPDAKAMLNIGIAGLVAALVYILKNLFTNSQDQFLKKEIKQLTNMKKKKTKKAKKNSSTRIGGGGLPPKPKKRK
jgi:hypothetical protein